MIRIESIDEKSPHLESVKRLWRSNSDWLGYYPDGAFLDRARRREILGLMGSDWEQPSLLEMHAGTLV
jgi:hypothetical protein